MNQDPKEEAEQQLIHAEMERKSHDVWRVYNPLDTDFTFYHNGWPTMIKAKSTKDIEFSKVRLFFRQISQYIIGQLKELKGQELLKKHAERGQGDYLDKYIENIEVWDKTPRLDNPELLKQVADQVVIGLVEEYGVAPAPVLNQTHKAVDTRSLNDQILDLFSKRIAPQVVEEKAKLAQEVSNVDPD